MGDSGIGGLGVKIPWLVVATGLAAIVGLRGEQLATSANWTLSGRVVDAATGASIAGAQVIVASDDKPLRTYRAWSGADGTYHFDTLRSGHYFVIVPVSHRTIDPAWKINDQIAIAGSIPPPVIKDPASRYQLALTPDALTVLSSGESSTYATTFYPSALTSLSGQAIAVTPSQPRPGVNIGLRRVAGHRVTGTVVGPRFGANGPGETLVLLSDDDRRFELGGSFGGAATASTLTQEGPFVFMSVPAGSYTLEAWHAVHGDLAGPRELRMPLTIGDSDVSGVVITVPVRDR
jgi:hypothetical protein